MDRIFFDSLRGRLSAAFCHGCLSALCDGHRLWVWVWGLMLFVPSAAFASDPPPGGTDPACGWDFFCIMKNWLHWAICEMLNLVKPIVTSIIEAVPDSWVPDVGQVMAYVEVLNAWVPLDFALGVMTAYFLFAIVIAVVRWVIALIPFL